MKYLVFEIYDTEAPSIRKGPFDTVLFRDNVINGTVGSEVHFVGTYNGESFNVDNVDYNQVTVE